MDTSQSLNRCSKLWLQVSKNFRRRTYAIFQQFTVHCTVYTCTLYVNTQKHLTILISDFSLKIAFFLLTSCISDSQSMVKFNIFIRVFAQILFNCCSTKIHGKTNGNSNYHSWNFFETKLCVRWVWLTTHRPWNGSFILALVWSVNCKFIRDPRMWQTIFYSCSIISQWTNILTYSIAGLFQ